MRLETYLNLRQLDEKASEHRYSIVEKQNLVDRIDAEISETQTVLVSVMKRRFDYIAAARYKGLVWSEVDRVASVAVVKLVGRLGEACSAREAPRDGVRVQ